MAEKENLFSEFPQISKEEWLSVVKKDLKGKSLDSLQWFLGNDIVLEPFYHPQDMETGNGPLSSCKSNDWEIGEDITVNDPKKANTDLLHALQNGVNAPRLILKNNLDAGQMESLFNDVNLSFISTHFKTNGFAYPIVNAFTELLTKRGQNARQIKGSINDTTLSPDNVTSLFSFIKENLPKFKCLGIEIPDEGLEKITDSLAIAISKGNDYLSALSESGFSLEEISRQIYFSTSVGNSYFVEIAKIRVLKILWLNILEAYGMVNPLTPYIEANLSSKNFEEDSNTNMIKSTTQAMSAVLGGVNRLTVLPADFLKGNSDVSVKRMARNVQHILKMESFFDRVADPAAGSYYVEKLTDILAEYTWEKLQEMVKT